MSKESVPSYKKFDENGNWILNEEYLMSYSHRDGFTERLLSVDLLVDKEFKVTVFHSCLRLGPYHEPGADGFFFKLIAEKTPLEILSFNKKINGEKKIGLKKNYDGSRMVIDDASSRFYLFNNNSKTEFVDITDFFPLTEDFFTTELQREFLRLHLFITDWTEKIYGNYIENYEK